MPGLSLICTFDKPLGTREEEFAEILKTALFDERYSSRTVYRDTSCLIGCTAYDRYPLSFCEGDDYSIIMEGRIYGNGPAEAELSRLGRMVTGMGRCNAEEIGSWQLGHDGDFVIVVADRRTREITVIPDMLGRLPLYYAECPESLVISREVGVTARSAKKGKISRMALAQYLLFRFPQGQRTLMEGISRLTAGEAIRIHPDEARWEILRTVALNFEQKADGRTGVKEYAARMAEAFATACRGRADAFPGQAGIVALSGGLDSRAVGAGLAACRCGIRGATYLDSEGRSAEDACVAGLVAEAAGIGWRLIALSPPERRDYDTLMEMKWGLNYLGMSYILPFHRRIREIYGEGTVLFTGDGGQVLKPEVRLHTRGISTDSLAEEIVRRFGFFPLRQVERLTGIAAEDILHDLASCLGSYPETGAAGRYEHFVIYEENVKYCFEGEDRNRYSFWSMTPFYSLPFFLEAVRSPDAYNNGFRLCRAFLEQLSPAIAKIDNADWGAPVASMKTRLFPVYHGLPGPIKKLVRRIIKGGAAAKPGRTAVAGYLEQQTKVPGAIGEYLCPAELARQTEGMTRQQLEAVFTVTSLIEKLADQDAGNPHRGGTSLT